MGRFLHLGFTGGLFPETDNQKDDQGYKTGGEQSNQQIRQHFHESDRITHHILDVVGSEGSSVHRHSLDFKPQTLKQQSIRFLPGKLSDYGELRQHIFSLVECSQDCTHLDVVSGHRGFLTRFINFEGVADPRPDYPHRSRVLQFRKGYPRSFRHLLEQDPVEQLVGYEYAVPFLQLLQKRSLRRQRQAGKSRSQYCQEFLHIALPLAE